MRGGACRVQHHQRQASNRWLFTEVTEAQEVLTFSSLAEVRLSVEAIYDGLNLP
jgi:hypothetical protein